MAQVNNYIIEDGDGLTVLGDLTATFQAVRDDNAGPTAPSNPVPGMRWRDTSVSPPVLRIRNVANSGWEAFLTANGATATGLSLLTSANAAAARTALALGGSAVLGVSTNTNFDADGTSVASRATIKTFVDAAIAPGVKAALNASGSAPIYACRAWVNFNGTGTVAIRAAGNVSSITDNGVGNYTVNFTTAMPDADYCAVVTGREDSAGSQNGAAYASIRRSSTAQQVGSINVSSGQGGTNTDFQVINVAIFR